MSETLKKHALKIQVGTIATVAIFIISMTVWVMDERAEIYTHLATAENQYEHCTKWYNGLEARMGVVESSDQQQDITQARIETQLAQIFTILEEIKTKL
jgi:hypothetical protein